jgi:inorganic phosphate transporter, PiT family
VLTSSGAVAFGIISLLPVELILQVGSGAGFSHGFRPADAAIIWNLGTWYFGLPASSSHTMIGSIIGVGHCQSVDVAAGSGTSGVDWGQARTLARCCFAARRICRRLSSCCYLMKVVIKDKRLYEAPEGHRAAAVLDSGLLVADLHRRQLRHGSNDGQKGMGLIMLILVGTVPTAYA